MPRKKRRYNTRRIKCSRNYTIQEVAHLFDVHINAVRRWITEGLPCIDTQKPFLVHGSELAAFHNARQVKRKHACKPTQAYCCKCRQPQPFWENGVDILIRNAKQLSLMGLCAVCSSKMNKAGSVTKLPEYEKIFHILTLQQEHLIGRSNPPVMCNLQRRL